ncbi:hypothetical protein M0811_07537 [Anaeramoeba ignava]|uniref:Signal peptidase complex subunit 2 n=1 Tax=Anaeramoeba ignava TaxID=1746090 RepID=A0A9Q0LKK3_ANAIG|nr:hypothetical protein M0811_07537 [Anaeramoeba ignava]
MKQFKKQSAINYGYSEDKKWTYLYNTLSILGIISILFAQFNYDSWQKKKNKTFLLVIIFFIFWIATTFIENLIEGKLIFFSLPKKFQIKKRKNEKIEYQLAIQITTDLKSKEGIFEVKIFERTSSNKFWFQYIWSCIKNFSFKSNAFLLSSYSFQLEDIFHSNGDFLQSKVNNQMKILLDNSFRKKFQ